MESIFNFYPVQFVPLGDNHIQSRTKFLVLIPIGPSRHALELPNILSLTVDVVMENCPTEAVLTNPASSHTVASHAA